MSYLDQVGLVVLCVQTSTDNVSGFPVCVTPQRCQLRLEMHSLTSACIPQSLVVRLNLQQLRSLCYIPLSIDPCSILQKHTVILTSINNWACWRICKWHLPTSVMTHMCLSACLISRWPSSGEFIRLCSSSSQKGIAQIVGTWICLEKKKRNQGDSNWRKASEIYSITKAQHSITLPFGKWMNASLKSIHDL